MPSRFNEHLIPETMSHEERCRMFKVAKLVRAIEKNAPRSSRVPLAEKLTEEQWAGLAERNDMRTPSQTTIDAVLVVLRERWGASSAA